MVSNGLLMGSSNVSSPTRRMNNHKHLMLSRLKSENNPVNEDDDRKFFILGINGA